MAVIKRYKSWYVDISYNGQRIRKRSPINKREYALDYETVLRQKLYRGEPLNDVSEKERAKKYSEFVWDWFEGYVKINNKNSEVLSKRSILKKHLIPFFGRTSLRSISTHHVEQFKASKLKEGYTKKTVDNLLMVLSKSLKSADEWYKLDSLPKIRFFKEPVKGFDYLTREESDLLLNHAEDIWYDMILVALRTGMRLGELIALSWEDINFDKRLLSVNHSIVRNVKGTPKSNKARHLPLTRQTVEALLRRRKESGYVFEYRDKYLRTDFCQTNLTSICERAGLRRITWHKLRHSYASHLAEAAVPMKVIQELMGHRDSKTTERYIHLSESLLQSAVDVLEPSNSRHYAVTNQNYLNFGESPMTLILPKIKQKEETNPLP